MEVMTPWRPPRVAQDQSHGIFSDHRESGPWPVPQPPGSVVQHRPQTSSLSGGPWSESITTLVQIPRYGPHVPLNCSV